MDSPTVQRTALHQAHIDAGGRLVEFAGFEMPVQYASVIAECKAVRERAGMFDVSHMARLTFEGERATEFLEYVTSNDISKLSDGTGQYSLLPNHEGGVVDDIIVYRASEDRYSMVVNAANHQKDVAWLNKHNTYDVNISDQTSETAMIAVQGPEAVRLLAEHSDQEQAMLAAPAFGLVWCAIEGIAAIAARSGYTGEDGFELVCNNRDAIALWDALLGMGIAPCGLASRDSLRVEAGLPLYGHELSDDMSPIAAGLGWVISKTKTFIGSDHINAARASGTPQKLQGIKLGSKRLLMPDMEVFVGDRKVGHTTSGVYSVVLETSIGFAFIDSDVALGTNCEVDVRGKREPGNIVSKRFFKRGQPN